MKIIESDLPHRGAFTVRSKTEAIILHHAETSRASVTEVNEWHLGRGWNGIGYHYYIRKDGGVFRGRPEWSLGAHAIGANDWSIGVCCEGAYMTETMPRAQLDSLKALLRELEGRYGRLKLLRHRDVSETDCPGDRFPWAEVKAFWEEDQMTKQEVRRMIEEALADYIAGSGDQPSTWARSAWDKAKRTSVMDGMAPRAPMTREMGAVVLDRLGLLDKAEGDDAK